MGRHDDIQTALKPLKKSEKIEINFHNHFRTSLIFYNNEPARPGQTQPDPTVMLFDSLYLKNKIQIKN